MDERENIMKYKLIGQLNVVEDYDPETEKIAFINEIFNDKFALLDRIIFLKESCGPYGSFIWEIFKFDEDDKWEAHIDYNNDLNKEIDRMVAEAKRKQMELAKQKEEKRLAAKAKQRMKTKQEKEKKDRVEYERLKKKYG
jgi:hypothetical protein